MKPSSLQTWAHSSNTDRVTRVSSVVFVRDRLEMQFVLQSVSLLATATTQKDYGTKIGRERFLKQTHATGWPWYFAVTSVGIYLSTIIIMM